MTIAAYTGPSPAIGYVGYINISRVETGIRITVRPESADGSGTVSLILPDDEAVKLFDIARAALGGEHG